MPSSLFDLSAGFSVVDVETTGDKSSIGYVIEIGIVNVRDFKITDTFHSLVKPPIPIPPFITKLTGLTDRDVSSAPVFADIAHKVEAMMEGHYFVAHHVHFDYAFIKSELERLGKYFYKDRFCTVNLSRKMLPQNTKHNLGALIEYFQIPVKARHRALDDAQATAEALIRFLKMPNAEEIFSKYAEQFDRRDKQLERLEHELFKLPNVRGVYMFKDTHDLPLYIGKSNHIRSRILGHVREFDIPRKRRLMKYTDHFDFTPCSSELEALILESRLIKQHQPPYNIQQRARKGYLFIKVTPDPYPRVFQVAEKKADGGHYIGPFRSGKFLDHMLRKLQRHYRLCPELMKERRSPKGFCFAHQLRQCSGACGEAISAEEYREQVEDAMAVLAEYIRIESKENIDSFLKSRDARSPQLVEFRKALRRVRRHMDENPDAFDEKFLLIQKEDRVGYFIHNGLLSKVLHGEELENPNLLETLSTISTNGLIETPEVLDERMTIQRFVRTHRHKLSIIPIRQYDFAQ